VRRQTDPSSLVNGLVLLPWARDLGGITLVGNTVLTAYIVPGRIIEESRIVLVSGELHRRCQAEVSMLVPLKRMTRWMPRGGKGLIRRPSIRPLGPFTTPSRHAGKEPEHGC